MHHFFLDIYKRPNKRGLKRRKKTQTMSTLQKRSVAKTKFWVKNESESEMWIWSKCQSCIKRKYNNKCANISLFLNSSL